MSRFEGDRRFSMPPAEVFAHLTDARFLVPCVPDVELVKVLEPNLAEMMLRPGFAFIRGTLDVKMHIVEAIAPTMARVDLSGKGIGSSSEIVATLTFAPDGDGCLVHWVAEIKSLGGLLRLAPSGLIRGAAEKVINDAWNKIEAALATGGQSGTGAS